MLCYAQFNETKGCLRCAIKFFDGIIKIVYFTWPPPAGILVVPIIIFYGALLIAGGWGSRENTSALVMQLLEADAKEVVSCLTHSL